MRHAARMVLVVMTLANSVAAQDSDKLEKGLEDWKVEKKKVDKRNLHDAATWIQQNWPDFDLETNHPVTWRGEQK